MLGNLIMTEGNGKLTFTPNVTLGSLIAAVPAIIACITLIVFINNLGNTNVNQDGRIDKLEKTSYTQAEAAAARERRDAQIKGLLDSITLTQNGINASINMLSNRMDRAFERLDALQTTVVELKTTLNIFQQKRAVSDDVNPPPRLMAPQGQN